MIYCSLKIDSDWAISLFIRNPIVPIGVLFLIRLRARSSFDILHCFESRFEMHFLGNIMYLQSISKYFCLKKTNQIYFFKSKTKVNSLYRPNLRDLCKLSSKSNRLTQNLQLLKQIWKCHHNFTWQYQICLYCTTCSEFEII